MCVPRFEAVQKGGVARLCLLGVESGGVCCPDGLNPTHAYWISGFKGIGYAILETLYSLANSLLLAGEKVH